MEKELSERPAPAMDQKTAIAAQEARLAAFHNPERTERYDQIRNDLGLTLAQNVGVYRNRADLETGVADVLALRARFKNIRVNDNSKIFNTNLHQVLELENMLLMAESVAKGALAREESRGSHSREDFPTRDDQKWHKHTLSRLNERGEVELSHKAVTMGRYPLEERKY